MRSITARKPPRLGLLLLQKYRSGRALILSLRLQVRRLHAEDLLHAVLPVDDQGVALLGLDAVGGWRDGVVGLHRLVEGVAHALDGHNAAVGAGGRGREAQPILAQVLVDATGSLQENA